VDALDEFSRNLRRLRKERGLTQERLAELSGLHLTDVGRIERAERDPGVRTVARLATGLGVPALELFRSIDPSEDWPG
jgi:transcriptional regulator with XRE-family HTH domain